VSGRTSVKKLLSPQAMRGILLGMRGLVRSYVALAILCNDREISKYTRAVSGQRLGKHVPAATDTNATKVQQQRNYVLYVVRAEMLLPGQVWDR
jgi:hypothetical protein